MAFTSSLLMNNVTPTAGIQNLVEANNNRPYIYDLLEFNSDMQDLDLTSKLEEYRLMTKAIAFNENGKDVAVIYEGMIANVFKRLAKMIRKLIDFIKGLFNNATESAKKKEYEESSKNAKKAYDDFEARTNKDDKSFFWKKNTFIFYRYPDIEKLDLDSIRKCLNGMVRDLQSAANGDDIEYDGRSMRQAYGSLKRSVENSATSIRRPTGDEINVVSNTSFLAFVRDQVCYAEEEEMTLSKYYAKSKLLKAEYPDDAKYKNASKLFEKELGEAERILSNTNNPTIPMKNLDLVKKIAKDICDVANTYIRFIAIIRTLHVKDFDYKIAVCKRINRAANKNNSTNDDYEYVDESSMMHGEPFNSDTLFDNEDLRDFNRTEWLDLNLTMECHSLKYELTEGRKTIAIKESLIISDDDPNKISRLQAMREAEEKKTNSKIETIINTIKKVLEKFMQALSEKFNTTTMYLRTNKRYIDRPIQLNSMKSTGDILAGMYRVQNKVNIIPFNYESMKDDLKDKKTFFKNRILPTLNNNPQCSKRKLAWSDDMEVSTYCKIYYGARMPEDNYPMCEFNSADMESNKSNIVRFLSEKNICFSAKADINNFEAQCRKINVTANTSSTTQQSSTETKPENDTGTKTESMYYSELYERWITEADIDMGNVQNAEGAPKPNNDIYNAYRVYTDCYKDVLFAKMTGCEFIFTELMQLMSMHVAKNGGPKMVMGQKDNNQQAKPTNN